MLPEHSRSRLSKLIEEGKVLVDGAQRKPSYFLREGERVDVAEVEPLETHDLTPADIPLDIRFEDEHLLVVNKPRGLAVHPAASLKEPSLVNALLARGSALSSAGGGFRPGIVHRLDKDTTGLLIVAKTDAVHVKLAREIERRHTSRRYVAVAAGYIEHERFDINAAIARSKRNRLLMAVDPLGKAALTHFKKLSRLDAGTLLACALESGRTHQIRVHLHSTGHPVLGDKLYAPAAFRNVPLQLHAAFLAFEHPITGKKLKVFAEPPADFLGASRVRVDELDPF